MLLKEPAGGCFCRQEAPRYSNSGHHWDLTMATNLHIVKSGDIFQPHKINLACPDIIYLSPQWLHYAPSESSQGSVGYSALLLLANNSFSRQSISSTTAPSGSESVDCCTGFGWGGVNFTCVFELC